MARVFKAGQVFRDSTNGLLWIVVGLSYYIIRLAGPIPYRNVSIVSYRTIVQFYEQVA